MNIPSLPTDSLYKFMAISGIVISIFCFYFSFTISEERKLNNIKMESEMRGYISECEMLDDEMKDIKTKLRKLCSACGCQCFDKKGNIMILPKITSGDQNHEYAKQRAEIDSLLEQYAEKTVALVRKGRQIDLQKKLIESSEAHVDSYQIEFVAMMVVGTLLTLVGFSLWYSKIQVHQDFILKSEADKYRVKHGVDLQKDMD